VQESKGTHSILEGGDYHIAHGGHDVRIVDVQSGRSGHEATAIDPDQNWQAVGRVLRIAVVDEVVRVRLFAIRVL